MKVGRGQPVLEAPCHPHTHPGPCPEPLACGRNSLQVGMRGCRPSPGKEELGSRACADLVQTSQGGSVTLCSGRTHNGLSLTHPESETSHPPNMGASGRLSLY